MQIMDYYSALKRNEPSTTKRHGGNSDACYGVKEASLRRLRTVCSVLEKERPWREQRSVVARDLVGGKDELTGQRECLGQ